MLDFGHAKMCLLQKIRKFVKQHGTSVEIGINYNTLPIFRRI